MPVRKRRVGLTKSPAVRFAESAAQRRCRTWRRLALSILALQRVPVAEVGRVPTPCEVLEPEALARRAWISPVKQPCFGSGFPLRHSVRGCSTACAKPTARGVFTSDQVMEEACTVARARARSATRSATRSASDAKLRDVAGASRSSKGSLSRQTHEPPPARGADATRSGAIASTERSMQLSASSSFCSLRQSFLAGRAKSVDLV